MGNNRKERLRQSQQERIEVRIQAGYPVSEKQVVALGAVKHLTVFVRGEELPGSVLGHILQVCRSRLESLTILRKDNDWDAPNTLLSWGNCNDAKEAEGDKKLADGLRHHPTLKKFSLTGFTTATATTKSSSSSLAETSHALSTVPHLSYVKLAAQQLPPSAASSSTASSDLSLSQHSTVPAEALQKILAKKSIAHLSVLGLIPESVEHTRVLQNAYVRDKCRAHVYVQFSNSGRTSRPNTRFSYYIREVMELNQKGRDEVEQSPTRLIKLLKHATKSGRSRGPAAKSSLSSLDGIYLLLRENPWIFSSAVENDGKGSSHRGMWSRLRRFVPRNKK